jgi:hypothetical protein
MPKNDAHCGIDSQRIDLPAEIAGNLRQHVQTSLPDFAAPHEWIKPRAAALSDEEIDQRVQSDVRSDPKVVQRLADIDAGRGWHDLRKREFDDEKEEALRARGRLKAQVPRSQIGAFSLLGHAKDVASTLLSWSTAAVVGLTVLIAFFFTAEVGGTQLSTLMASDLGWAQSPLAAFGFCLAFSISTMLLNRCERQLRQSEQATVEALKSTTRWKLLAWASLVTLGAVLGLVHIKEVEWHSPLQLALMMAGPALLAKSCIYLEERVDHHRRRMFEMTLQRNPAFAAAGPEIHEHNTNLGNLKTLDGLINRVLDQIDFHEKKTAADWRGVRDDYRRLEEGLAEIHRIEEAIESGERKRRQAVERLRLYDPQALPDDTPKVTPGDNDQLDQQKFA